MYLLTKNKDDLESGAYASLDDEGTPIVQFFEREDDAVTYKTFLEALDQKLYVTEAPDEVFDKFCHVFGHAYTIVEDGDIVIPRFETLHHSNFVL
jgi:hypothetical protein